MDHSKIRAKMGYVFDMERPVDSAPGVVPEERLEPFEIEGRAVVHDPDESRFRQARQGRLDFVQAAGGIAVADAARGDRTDRAERTAEGASPRQLERVGCQVGRSAGQAEIGRGDFVEARRFGADDPRPALPPEPGQLPGEGEIAFAAEDRVGQALGRQLVGIERGVRAAHRQGCVRQAPDLADERAGPAHVGGVECHADDVG